jgi:hypothetical protein
LIIFFVFLGNVAMAVWPLALLRILGLGAHHCHATSSLCPPDAVSEVKTHKLV